MKTVGDELRDSAARHTVYLLRYANSVYRKHSSIVDKAIAELTYKLSIRSPNDNSFTAKRLKTMLASVKEVNDRIYKELAAAVNQDLKELAAYEAKVQVEIIEDAYPIALSIATVTPAQIHSAALGKPFQGRILYDWWNDQKRNVQRAYESALRMGYVQGESISQITRRLQGVGEMNKRQIEAVVRTAVRHTSQVTLNSLAEENPQLIQEEEWVATLDGRTSSICQSLDGKRFEVGKGPQPPAHFNCRSTRVPVPSPWSVLYGSEDENASLNKRPFVADKRRVKDIPKTERNSIIGSTTAKSYNEWLRTQKPSFVEDVLGKKKAELYLNGDVSLDRFVERTTGRTYTLDELYKREKAAFKKAGIEP